MERQISKNDAAFATLTQVQIPFYEFVSLLRDDYHKSNKELKELRERASRGENIIGPILEMVRPERLSLKRYDIQELGFTPEEAVALTKKKTKN